LKLLLPASIDKVVLAKGPAGLSEGRRVLVYEVGRVGTVFVHRPDKHLRLADGDVANAGQSMSSTSGESGGVLSVGEGGMIAG
jgi:hypothetical protein